MAAYISFESALNIKPCQQQINRLNRLTPCNLRASQTTLAANKKVIIAEQGSERQNTPVHLVHMLCTYALCPVHCRRRPFGVWQEVNSQRSFTPATRWIARFFCWACPSHSSPVGVAVRQTYGRSVEKGPL